MRNISQWARYAIARLDIIRATLLGPVLASSGKTSPTGSGRMAQTGPLRDVEWCPGRRITRRAGSRCGVSADIYERAAHGPSFLFAMTFRIAKQRLIGPISTRDWECVLETSLLLNFCRAMRRARFRRAGLYALRFPSCAAAASRPGGGDPSRLATWSAWYPAAAVAN
jgi:hypothetical protein